MTQTSQITQIDADRDAHFAIQVRRQRTSARNLALYVCGRARARRTTRPPDANCSRARTRTVQTRSVRVFVDIALCAGAPSRLRNQNSRLPRTCSSRTPNSRLEGPAHSILSRPELRKQIARVASNCEYLRRPLLSTLI